MTVRVPSVSTRREDGVELFTLRNERVEVTVAPELGAKVISLKNLRTGRDWFSIGTRPKLFRNQLCADFAASTLFGWDECLPTVAACQWNGRSVPDHGEVWSVPWHVDFASDSALRTSVTLAKSPLRFSRELLLDGNIVTANYSLTSESSEPEKFLWAMHPLVAPRDGDRVVLPREARRQLADAAWLDTLAFPGREPSYVKAFVTPLVTGRASVVNDRTSNRLTFEWNATENDTLGIWLTRGGWHGCHHLALEPTNAPADSLAQAAAHKQCGSIVAVETKTWAVRLLLEP